MIIVKSIGGLGNQMFQVAYAYSIAKNKNDNIYIDTSAYEKYLIRSYSLNHLVIDERIEELSRDHLTKSYYYKMKLSQKVYRVFQKIWKLTTRGDVIGKHFFEKLSNKGLFYNFDVYYYSLKPVDKNIITLYGYFQSEKYFIDYKDEIKELLKVKTPIEDEEKLLLRQIQESNSVGVSIRIGKDYTENNYFNVCNYNYYYNAMKKIKDMHPEIIFFIFSDDIDKVKREFDFDEFNIEFVGKGFKDYQSLRLLYSCKHFIISNSSFSWWGAYLGEYESKQVFAPSKWYNGSSNTPDIYYDSMKLIEVTN